MRSVPVGVSRMTARPLHRVADLPTAPARCRATNCSPASDQRHAARGAVEQPHAEPRLQPGDRVAERRASTCRARSPPRGSCRAAPPRAPPRVRSVRMCCIVPISATSHAGLYGLSGQCQRPISPGVHRQLAGEQPCASSTRSISTAPSSRRTATSGSTCYNPATAKVIGQVRLGDDEDARRAIAAAKRAFPPSRARARPSASPCCSGCTTPSRRARTTCSTRSSRNTARPVSRARFMATHRGRRLPGWPRRCWRTIDFTRRIGTAEVVMEPLGVVGLITPWNSNAGFICGKLATAIAAGCTAVIKPSEMSAIQTQVVTEALHEAGSAGRRVQHRQRPRRRGRRRAQQPSRHREDLLHRLDRRRQGDPARRRGDAEARDAGTRRQVAHASFWTTPTSRRPSRWPLGAGFMNSGQACIAGTRILVPRSAAGGVRANWLEGGGRRRSRSAIRAIPQPTIGPMVSQKQWERVQRYIRIGIEEGARLLAGGEGRPDGPRARLVRAADGVRRRHATT